MAKTGSGLTSGKDTGRRPSTASVGVAFLGEGLRLLSELGVSGERLGDSKGVEEGKKDTMN